VQLMLGQQLPQQVEAAENLDGPAALSYPQQDRQHRQGQVNTLVPLLLSVLSCRLCKREESSYSGGGVVNSRF